MIVQRKQVDIIIDARDENDFVYIMLRTVATTTTTTTNKITFAGIEACLSSDIFF